MSLGEYFPKFRTIVVPASSRLRNPNTTVSSFRTKKSLYCPQVVFHTVCLINSDSSLKVGFGLHSRDTLKFIYAFKYYVDQNATNICLELISFVVVFISFHTALKIINPLRTKLYV